MKKTILSLGISLACLPILFGQLGLNINYHKSDYPVWNEVLENYGISDFLIFNQQYQLALDYGFSLRQYRVEIYPGLSYSRGGQYHSDYNQSGNLSIDFDLKKYGLFVRTQVYPFDLLSKKGMQCPSFHRGGDIFTKGWFVSVQPELVYSEKSLHGYQYEQAVGMDKELDSESSKVVFAFGIGTGIDIGISNSFSITPTAMYAFVLGEKWPGFSQEFEQKSYNDATSASYVSIGVRIGLWF